MRIRSLVYKLWGPAVLAGLLVMSLLIGCRRGPDPRLAAADSIMEEHPDSALLLLDDYSLSSESSEADCAYYALLLTHARYKNFIDETDDSLITVAADYFLDHHDGGKASRALFLKGMIQMNANRLGDAAVSFRKGLDLAHDGKHHMWEGQCAFGLYALYGELLDGSAQVNYAKMTNEAFSKTDDEGWKSYSKLVLARAYHNNFKYEESLSILKDLCKDVEKSHDIQELPEIVQLQALSLFALGRYDESLANYAKAYELDTAVLHDNDIRNIRIAIHEVLRDSIPEEMAWLNDKLKHLDSANDSFDVLSDNGKYKEAYESLLRYKNQQDSVISVIYRNNVTESMNQYDLMKSTMKEARKTKERLTYWLSILTLIVISMLVLWRFREGLHREESKRLKAEADMESVRSDLLAQLDSVRNEVYGSRQILDETKTEDFLTIIRKRYADANRLCDDCYQGGTPNKQGSILSDVDRILRDFRDESSLNTIEAYVDEKSGGLYTSFKRDFFSLTTESFRLFLFIMLGFSSRSIAAIIGQRVDAVYNRKSRLKTHIKQSKVPEKEKYLKFF